MELGFPEDKLKMSKSGRGWGSADGPEHIQSNPSCKKSMRFEKLFAKYLVELVMLARSDFERTGAREATESEGKILILDHQNMNKAATYECTGPRP